MKLASAPHSRMEAAKELAHSFPDSPSANTSRLPFLRRTMASSSFDVRALMSSLLKSDERQVSTFSLFGSHVTWT